MVDIQLNNEGADDSVPQVTPEKGITPNNQSIQQMETALRELLERQTREAEIATEAMKRAEAMAAKQQALLEEAERRDQELNEKLRNKLTYSDDDEVVVDSRSRTWKPSAVVGSPPVRENNKHPFSLASSRKNSLRSSNIRRIWNHMMEADALTWFNSLAPGSIKSFSDLSGGFLKNFTTRRRLPKTCLNLYSIVQKSEESLRDYLDCFNSECT
ncbi:hypothetical protein PIB30_000380 [Stylosanthes scabra]|uniref:Retrotransposon gag domain-containing protein n=1 Tax=Stylosanthes scabra TaxID=79078 RepID=A0ABU6U497_9FABA|nr:hypothetical protein [Stylosanthes scabra]